MSDIKELFNQFRDDLEKQEYFEKQQLVITNLLKEKKKMQDEIDHLKDLLCSTNQLLPTDNKVEKIIVTPEEDLIERQIYLIQQRGLERELTLEDTKKLDLLLKNKNLIKDENKPIAGESSKADKKNFTQAQLIQIASSKKNDNKE